jgi:TonB family protein
VPRCPIAVPVRVTVMRSGVPSAIPGRSLDLSERGIAAVLAGEVLPGDPVAIEFLLPDMGLGLHAKATVRHHAPLRSGLEFQTLSVEQRALIRRWTHRVLGTRTTIPTPPPQAPEPVSPPSKWEWLSSLVSRRTLATVGIGSCLFVLFAWWQWQRGWQELETAASAQSSEVKPQRLSVAPGVMEPLLIHKVDPVLPEGINRAGSVLVKVAIGHDGTVIDQHAMSGQPVMVRAAMDAVRQWRFQPYRVNGSPVEVETTLAVEFQETPAETQ